MLIHFIQAIILRLDDQRNEIVYSRPQCPNQEFDPQRSNEFLRDFFYRFDSDGWPSLFFQYSFLKKSVWHGEKMS